MIQCPYCGEGIWMEARIQDGQSQQFVEDCEVCCSPILYHAHFDSEGQLELRADRENG